MIELAKHIEVLLLENDCVIVPGLGGFVAHYTPAMRVAEDNIFLPPTRLIGFNSQLKMNDGLLVQSYMAVYGTNFSDASKIVDKEVYELFATLHEEGKVDLSNVGELRYSVHDTYDFVPYDNKITTPYLYGLDSFEMQELSVLEKPVNEKIIPFLPVASNESKRKFGFRINPSYLSNAVAMIAIVALFFFLSTPIENTEVFEGNYAQLLPNELFEKIESQSLAITPIVVRQMAETPKASAQSKPAQSKKKRIVPVAVREVKVGQANTPASIPAAQPKNTAETSRIAAAPKAETKAAPASTATSKAYHIIIASVGTEKDAEVMAKQLIAKGFADAKAVVGEGKMRVSIESCNTEVEAYQALNKLRKSDAYQNAWVLKSNN